MDDWRKTKAQLIAELVQLRQQVATGCSMPSAPPACVSSAPAAWDVDGLAELFEDSPIGMNTLDPTGSFTVVNPAFCAFLGYRAEELRSKSVFDITHPKDLEKTRRHYERIFTGDIRSFYYQKRFLRKDGATVWGHVSCAWSFDRENRPLFGLGLVQDITEIHKAQRAYREKAEELQATIESFDGYIYTCTSDRRIASMNANLIRRTGYDATGEICHRVLHDRDEACPWCVNDRVFQGERVSRELLSPKDHRWYYAVNVPRTRDNGEMVKQAMVIDITERKKAEAALGETEQLFRGFFDTSSAAMAILDPQGDILRVNPQGCSYLGYQQNELIGRNVTEVIHPLDRQKALDLYREARSDAENPTFSQQQRYLRADGEVVWGHVSAAWVHAAGHPKYCLVLVQDITRSKQNEMALRLALQEAEKGRERINAIVRSVSGGLIVTDPDKRILLMNSKAEVLLGFDFAGSQGRPLTALFDDEALRNRLVSLLETGRESGPVDFDLPGQSDGPRRTLRARTSPIIDRQGRKSGVITTLHDVTRERDIDRMKSDFISTAAHELRTPLTTISGFSQLMLLQEDLAPEQRRKFLTYISQQGDALTRIVEEMLDISRIERGIDIPLRKEWCMVGDMMTMIEPIYSSAPSHHRFQVSVEDEQRLVEIDRQKMSRVLENLISNAIKYSPEGGLIRITGSSQEKGYQFTVEDNGIGMNAEQVERVFDKFYRADASNTAIGGFGLGMNIVKQIIEAHGGRIWVDSKLGQGTRVGFLLP